MLKTLLEQNTFKFRNKQKKWHLLYIKVVCQTVLGLLQLKSNKTVFFIYQVLDISFGMSRTELSSNNFIHKLLQSIVGGAALWLGRWIDKLEGQFSNIFSYQWMNLCLVVPNLTYTKLKLLCSISPVAF